MRKSDLRRLYQKKRSELGSEERDKRNHHILRNFSSLDFSNFKYIHFFYPIIARAEVNTLILKDWLEAYHPGINLVLSKSDVANHTLRHFLWDGDTRLSPNQWGITEPDQGVEVPAEKLDLILVPLLAFDKAGNRIGYGKGFYDRFLSHCRPDALKTGLSYFPPEDSIEDASDHDIPLDICITPEKIWTF